MTDYLLAPVVRRLDGTLAAVVDDGGEALEMLTSVRAALAQEMAALGNVAVTDARSVQVQRFHETIAYLPAVSMTSHRVPLFVPHSNGETLIFFGAPVSKDDDDEESEKEESTDIASSL